MIENSEVKIRDIAYSKDTISRKYVQTTADDYRIETLYVDYKNKYIICFSTQVGCVLYNGTTAKIPFLEWLALPSFQKAASEMVP